VRHQEHSQSLLQVQASEEIEHDRSRSRVQVPGRLVAEEKLRLRHERTRDGGALLLTTRELRGPPPEGALDASGLQTLGAESSNQRPPLRSAAGPS